MSEYFDVVDEKDKVIGKATREKAHKNRLIHRSVMLFIFNKEGEVFVNQRTENKEFFPGYWSIVIGGHAHAGESYEEAAIRELKEEAGIKEKPFLMKSFKKRIPEEKENVRVFGVITNKSLRLHKGELKKGEFLTLKELKNKIKKEKFLPETNELYKIFLKS